MDEAEMFLIPTYRRSLFQRRANKMSSGRIRSSLWGHSCHTSGRGRVRWFLGKHSALAAWCQSSRLSSPFPRFDPAERRTVWNKDLQDENNHSISESLSRSVTISMVGDGLTLSWQVDALVDGCLVGVIVNGQFPIECHIKWSIDSWTIAALDVQTLVESASPEKQKTSSCEQLLRTSLTIKICSLCTVGLRNVPVPSCPTSSGCCSGFHYRADQT